jgi:hypothetical protein
MGFGFATVLDVKYFDSTRSGHREPLPEAKSTFAAIRQR